MDETAPKRLATEKRENNENFLKEVQNEIIDLKRNKAPGADSITAEMIKFRGETSINNMP